MTTQAKTGRIPELDGLRVLMIFIVSWYHIWQQSWMAPAADILGIRINLDWLVRSGYVWVDGTVLLSAFLLYLPLARRGRGELPDVKAFYLRKARRILPDYWLILLIVFLGICLPWNLYNGNGPFLAKDLFTHLTLIFPYWRDTYIYTPLGAASWTLSVVAQAYLLFPLLAKAMRKHPAATLATLCTAAFAFRAWCLWGMTDYSMVVNTFVNFLDVYALGFGCALLFAKLESLPEPAGGRRWLRPAAATLVFAGCLTGLCLLLDVQAYQPDHAALQGYQMMLRPVFALCFAGLILSAPFSFRPLRKLLGNRVTAFLAAISMNYYLIHQTLAVHLRRIGFPPSVSETPNLQLEQPWQSWYTLAAFGFSFIAAILVTYGVKALLAALKRRNAAKEVRV